jgi:hypothetical protein
MCRKPKENHLRLEFGCEGGSGAGGSGAGRCVASPKNGLRGVLLRVASYSSWVVTGASGHRAQASWQVGGYSLGTLPFSLWAFGRQVWAVSVSRIGGRQHDNMAL